MHEAALETYLRIIYFDTGELYIQEALLQTANLYAEQGRYGDAAVFYERAARYLSPADAYSLYLQRIRCLLAEQRYTDAYEELLYLQDLPEADTTAARERIWLEATALFGLQEYEGAFGMYETLLDDRLAEEKKALRDVRRKLNRANRKSETLAFYMSTILPGTGQLYAHDYRNAINSLLLSGGFMVLGIHTGIQYGVLHSLLVVLPWWGRYHIGGMQRASESVRNYKHRRKYEAYREIRRITGHE